MNLQDYIYLDFAATTPADDRVVEAMIDCLRKDGIFGNAASRSHRFGWLAEEKIDHAREQVASLLGCDSREIVWTSGATESDNLAIKGAVEFYGKTKGKHVVTSKIEHKAVLDSCRYLESEGYRVTYVDPDEEGIIHPSAVEAAIESDTCIVSIMHVNNELGTINDIEAIGEICRRHSVLFHVDAAQSVGKLPINLSELPVDLLSISAHKVYGPKGIGALYVQRKPRIRLNAQIHGGGHERGMRSGTLPTHQIVGFGEACAIAESEMQANWDYCTKLQNMLFDQLVDPQSDGLEEVRLNGHRTQKIPQITNISFNYVEGESLIMAINRVAVSSGSACTSASLEPSYVLRAIGVPDEIAHSSLRFSTSYTTTDKEVQGAIDQVKDAVNRLRELSPLWDMYKDGVDLSKIEWTVH